MTRMQTRLQVIERTRASLRRAIKLMSMKLSKASRASVAVLIVTMLLTPTFARAQGQTQQPPPSSQPQQSPPAGTTRQGQQPAQPGTPPPASNQLPPNSSSAPLRPSNEAQQSQQPQTGVEQERQQTTPNTQGPRPPTPQVQPPQTAPGQSTQTATPASTTAPQGGQQQGTTTPGAQPATGVAQPPGQQVGVSPSILPAELPTEPPPVAPNFEAPTRPLPSAERVGVDIADQTPLTLNDAIALALRNNNDIDGSRIDVEIAEQSLRAARGVYDPVLSSENYFERRTTPTASTLGGAGATGSVTQTDQTGSARLGGFTPFFGGSYQFDLSATRLTTNNQNVTLNPQYPAAFTFTYTQPLLRGLRFDNNRRQIEIAKKNL